MESSLPLLPLVVDEVPPGLVLALGQEGIPMATVSGAWVRGVPRDQGRDGGASGEATCGGPSAFAGRPAVCSRQAHCALPEAEGAQEHGRAPLGRFLLYDSRRAGQLAARGARARGQCPLDIDALRRGWPFDAFQALIDTRSRRVGWAVGDHLLSEQVSYYPKAEIRRQIMAGLRALVEGQGGVWLRLSAYPFPYRSAFNFRIDYDDGEPDDFHALVRQIQGHEGCTSHFVCASGFEAEPSLLRALAGLDVGSHGWWHHTYRRADQNRANVARGIRALREWGLDPKGFVAPHGRWNAGLAAVLEELDVSHSSEFALAHDDVPFFAYLGEKRRPGSRKKGSRAGGQGSELGGVRGQPGRAARGRFCSVLQLPVHPVCLGLFLEAGVFDPAVVESYFEAVLHAKYERGEPILMYGHPTGRLGRWPGVLRTIFRTADEFSALWRTTLSGFADWWRARSEARFTVYSWEAGYEVQASGLPPTWPLALEYWRDNRVAVIPVERPWLRFSPGELGSETRRAKVSLPPRVPLPDRRGLKQAVRRWLDWELVTPTSEIAMNTLPGLVKRGLRVLAGRAAR